jgi:hypothetical protein
MIRSKDEWIPARSVVGVNADGSLIAVDSWGGKQRGPTLTDAEREAVRYMIAAGKFGQRDEALTEEHAATLRGLLERMK